jgi:hypothetical protein
MRENTDWRSGNGRRQFRLDLLALGIIGLGLFP